MSNFLNWFWVIPALFAICALVQYARAQRIPPKRFSTCFEQRYGHYRGE